MRQPRPLRPGSRRAALVLAGLSDGLIGLEHFEIIFVQIGGFLLHLTLHQPTQQPLDTLYTLRLDPGRQTIATLIFIREAFGYKEPLFPQEMLDKFMQQKMEAHRTK